MQKYLFLTGATGLLGRYLVRDLLVRGRHLALLARGSHHETAQQRIESIISYWETELNRPLPRPVVLEGDICQAGLGLSASDQKWVEQHCDEVVHRGERRCMPGTYWLPFCMNFQNRLITPPK